LSRAEKKRALELAEAAWPPRSPVEERGRHWHCARCVSAKGDERVLRWLSKFGVETYYPRLRIMRKVKMRDLTKKQRADGVVLVRPQLVPFLPRYVFVHMDPGRRDARDIFDRAGIGGMVAAADNPIRVPDELIATLQGNEVSGGIPGEIKARHLFDLGEQVRIRSGPFRDFVAVVEKLPDIDVEGLDLRTRLIVSVNVFGGATPVSLALDHVEKV